MGEAFGMNQRFLDYVLAEDLHPVPIVFRFVVADSVNTVTIDRPQQLPHREFVHQRFEPIIKRECRWLVPLFSLLGRSGRALGRLSDRVGYGVTQPE